MASLNEIRRLQKKILDLESFLITHGINSSDGGQNIKDEIELTKQLLAQAEIDYNNQLALEKELYEKEEFDLIQKLGKAQEELQLFAQIEANQQNQVQIEVLKINIMNIENELAFFREETDTLIFNRLIGDPTLGYSIEQTILKKRINDTVIEVNEVIGSKPVEIAGVVNFDPFAITTTEELLKLKNLLDGFPNTKIEGLNMDSIKELFAQLSKGEINLIQALQVYQGLINDPSITKDQIENLIDPNTRPEGHDPIITNEFQTNDPELIDKLNNEEVVIQETDLRSPTELELSYELESDDNLIDPISASNDDSGSGENTNDQVIAIPDQDLEKNIVDPENPKLEVPVLLIPIMLVSGVSALAYYLKTRKK
ncbi:hypothetical protein [Nitrosopumilus spindle-shaped virus]|uniref:Uncharacterized protein n=1 Tax=Nitrosopumilus spindle-shaped virus TaxID=2508184 RepID=A0A514K357_9VIRU|nr:hypothetical protein [Nitrosopumilus spindle-shaped virus]